ncbi:hypothetical protein D3C81_1767100 [compost metagenome]
MDSGSAGLAIRSTTVMPCIFATWQALPSIRRDDELISASGGGSRSSDNRWISWTPSRPGIIRSLRTRSKSRSCSRRRASSPSSAASRERTPRSRNRFSRYSR